MPRFTRPDACRDGRSVLLHHENPACADALPPSPSAGRGAGYPDSPAFRDQYGRKPPTGRDAKVKISWRLWLGKDQLVRRVQTSWTELVVNGTSVEGFHVIDARLTGWGAETDIPVPSADETAEQGAWKDSPSSALS
ncbi:hypothetical protein ACWDOR_33855 [Streptosporangium canum]|uniref:hypothetical protein n=1 Tax=Streptosporangium canum TaxID=324952 RepID=UPI0036A30926